VGVPAAPTVFGPDRLKVDLTADFSLRGIVVDSIDIGAWKLDWLGGPARVVIGNGKGQYASAADTFHSTDGWIDIGGGQVARAILARVWTFPVWVHAIASVGGPPDQEAEAQMRATLALSDQTAAAIARTRGGLPMLPWPAEILNEDLGEAAYGCVMHFDAIVAIPVFDDPWDTGTADQVTTSGQLDLDGTFTPLTAENSIVP